MLVCIDIGNTNITMGIFEKDELIERYRFNTKVRRTSDEYGFMIKNFLEQKNLAGKEVEGVIISSVVPKIMHSFRNGIVKFLGIEPMILRPDMKTGIKVCLENPRSVGSDRIADCVGAYYTYGGPVLIADFGTATTYDYVDKDGNFTSGVIAVGIESGANALWSQTAQLPEVEIKKPETILATNTQSEMQAGIFYQFLGGFEKTVDVFRQALDEDFKVIVTGGLGRVICPYTDLIDQYDPNLIFKGLRHIFLENQKS